MDTSPTKILKEQKYRFKKEESANLGIIDGCALESISFVLGTYRKFDIFLQTSKASKIQVLQSLGICLRTAVSKYNFFVAMTSLLPCSTPLIIFETFKIKR